MYICMRVRGIVRVRVKAIETKEKKRIKSNNEVMFVVQLERQLELN